MLGRAGGVCLPAEALCSRLCTSSTGRLWTAAAADKEAQGTADCVDLSNCEVCQSY